MHKLGGDRQSSVRHCEQSLPLQMQSKLMLAQLEERDHNRMQVGDHRVA